MNQDDIEAVWREAWIAAPDGALTFQEQLTSGWQTARALNRGSSLSNLSQGSSSHGYATPDAHTLTTVDKERIALAAIKLYEKLARDLYTDDEDEIYQEGIAQFAAAPSGDFRVDFSCLR